MLAIKEYGDCSNCPKEGRSGKNMAVIVDTPCRTLNGSTRSIKVLRCLYCDTSPCAVCKTRTMRVNQARCNHCGHGLIPKSQDS